MVSEKYSNNANSTLSSTITNSVTSLSVASAVSFPTTGNFRIIIDTEIMLVTNVSGTTFTVTRGHEGTTAASHTAGASVDGVITKGSLDQIIIDNHQSDLIVNIPSAEKQGRLFFPSNAFHFYRDSGSVWQAFGPVRPITPYNDSGFSWVNQGSSTFTVANNIGFLSVPGTGNTTANLVARVMAVPATPYVLEAMLVPSMQEINYTAFGLCWRNSSSGKIITHGHVNDKDQVAGYMHWHDYRKWDSPTVSNSLYAYTQWMEAFWFRIEDDGTNRKAKFSSDGYNWTEPYPTTVGHTDFITPDQIGFFVNPRTPTTIPVSLSVLHLKVS